MPYRKLEPRELTHLAYAWTQWDAWQEVARYTHEIYGPAAASVAVEVAYEYDDMGAYFPSVTGVTAKDMLGAILEPDLSTEWWREYLGDVTATDDDAWAREQAIRDAIEERGYAFPIPAEDTTWDFARPPALPFDAVFVYDDTMEA